MAIFKQHIPAFVEGVERREFEFNTLEELKAGAPLAYPENHYCYDKYFDCQLLMESTPDNEQWIVLGYVIDFDLSKHLPKFVMKDEVYESV